MLKVSFLMATSLKILVANTFFSVALATSWMQIQTLDNNSCQKLAQLLATLLFCIIT